METHGHIEFSWSNDILYVKTFGPFNYEGGIKSADAYMDQINKRKCLTFSVIEILDDDSLGSPDTMKIVSRMWAFLEKNDCKSLALIPANDIQLSLAHKFLPSFGKAFKALHDAELWLKAIATHKLSEVEAK